MGCQRVLPHPTTSGGGGGGQAEALSSRPHRGLKVTVSPCCSLCGWDLAAGVSPGSWLEMQTRGPPSDPQDQSLHLNVALRFTHRTEGGSLQPRGAHRLGAPSPWNPPGAPWAPCQPGRTVGCHTGSGQAPAEPLDRTFPEPGRRGRCLLRAWVCAVDQLSPGGTRPSSRHAQGWPTGFDKAGLADPE